MLALKILWLFLIIVPLESVVIAEENNTTTLNYQLKAEDNPSSVRLNHSTRGSDERTTTSATIANESVSPEENTSTYSDLPAEEDRTQFEKTFLEHTTTDRTEKNVDILLFRNNTININIAHENNNTTKNMTYAEVDGPQFGETFIDTIKNNITKIDITEHDNINTTENITNAEEEGIQLEETSINTTPKSVDEIFSKNLAKMNIAQHGNNNASKNITNPEEDAIPFEKTFIEYTTTDAIKENVDILLFKNNIINTTYTAHHENNKTMENKTEADTPENNIDVLVKNDTTKINIAEHENNKTMEDKTEAEEDTPENNIDVLLENDTTKINIAEHENNNATENITDSEEDGTQFEETFLDYTTTDRTEENNINITYIAEQENNNATENITDSEEDGTQFEETFLDYTTTDRTEENNINITYIAEQENNKTKENKIEAEENGTQLEETFTGATENSVDVLFKSDKTQINIVKDENNNARENTTDANETQFQRTFIEHTTTDTIEESVDVIFKNSIIEPEVNNTMENTTSALDVTVEDIFNEPPPNMRVPQYKIDSIGLSEVITRWLEEQHRQQVSAGSSSDLNKTESVSELQKKLPQQYVDVPSKDIEIEPTFMTPETYTKNITTASRMAFPDYSDLSDLDTTIVNKSEHYEKILFNGDAFDTEGILGVSLNVSMEIFVDDKRLYFTSDFSVDSGYDSQNLYMKLEWYDVENDCNVSVKFQIQCENRYCFVDGLSIEIKNYSSDETALVVERKHLELFKIISETTLFENSSSIFLNMGHGVVVTFYDVVFFAREGFIKSLASVEAYQFDSYYLEFILGAIGFIICGTIALYIFKKFRKGRNHFKPETA